jgi:hypothetical protein
MPHRLELTGQLGDKRDSLEIGCHKNSSDCRFLETEELLKAAKWAYETNRSPNESLRFRLQQPAQKAAVLFSCPLDTIEPSVIK